ncbi:MAG: RagB/SusD family nutrient uptake outer membrane protein [Tannerellaceae bacterium]|nr:RagB/SusD family nutrient uptake outer membrane protein [Tannerellaceae bacterium]
MKKIYKTMVGITCGALLAFTSCLNDLNTEPLTDNILLPEKAWENEASYEQFLAKIYAGFSLSGNEAPSGMPDISAEDQGESTFLRSYWNLQQITTDETSMAWSDEGLNGLQFLQWVSSNRFCELIYNRTFTTIAFSNEYLRETTEDKLLERGVNEAKRNEINTFRYEARVMRAMNYFFLMDLFGSIPLVLEEDGVGSFVPVQVTRAAMFEWLEAELKACEGHLPPKNMENYGKVNDPTVWMILAKMYLNAEVYANTNRYTDCITYLNKILAAGIPLENTYKNMFGADNHLSSEIIFPVAFDGKFATTYGGTTYLMAASYASDMNPGTTFGLSQSWSGVRALETLTNLFDDADQRALFWTEDRTKEVTQWTDFKTGWSVIKYTNLNSDGTPGSDNQFADTDYPLFRLADAYLMYAEAVLRGGQGGSKAQAVEYVNALRRRAGVSAINESQLTLDFILDERARELYWEGHRRTDLIRFDRFTRNYAWPWKNGVQAGTTNVDDKYKLFPIPAVELAANSAINQNPGY